MTAATEAKPRGFARLRKKSLDKDLRKLERVEDATRSFGLRLFAPGLALVFLVLCAVFAGTQIGSTRDSLILVAAAILAGYMALNIGANDVANNIGPAVGSRALTLTGALAIAAVFECAGALIAGGDVVQTISKDIVDPSAVADGHTFVTAMMSALIASAIWVNVATYIGAPVSTTHAVVGGVIGAGIPVVGLSAVNWAVMGAIALSWVISPLLGGAIAAAILSFIKVNLIYRMDKIAAARLWIPVLTALMGAVFSAYLMMKGLSKVWSPSSTVIIGVSALVFLVSLAFLRPLIRLQSEGMENRNQSLRQLFHLPLICSAALLSFAHGSNDVANAVGPLAGILHSSETGSVAERVALPLWIMIIGGFGISIGLFLFGPKLVRTVGEQITRLNPMRAFSVALSAAITVIIASALGLPVSSTHIAVGAVFGVGFFREYYTVHSSRRRAYLAAKGVNPNAIRNGKVEAQELVRRKLVRRSHFTIIVAAWLITVPAAALLAAAVYRVLALIT